MDLSIVLPTISPTTKIDQNDKCGYGPRIPMLLISPYTQKNFIDHNRTDFTSILKFIEDNWRLGRIGGGSLDAILGLFLICLILIEESLRSF